MDYCLASLLLKTNFFLNAVNCAQLQVKNKMADMGQQCNATSMWFPTFFYNSEFVCHGLSTPLHSNRFLSTVDQDQRLISGSSEWSAQRLLWYSLIWQIRFCNCVCKSPPGSRKQDLLGNNDDRDRTRKEHIRFTWWTAQCTWISIDFVKYLFSIKFFSQKF